MGTPVWEHNGVICTGETYKDKVVLTFIKGVSLKDLASLDGNTRSALGNFKGNDVAADAFTALIRDAISFYGVSKTKPARKAKA